MERKTKVTKQDQTDPVKQSLERLEKAVSAIQTDEDFRKYLLMQARFHNYSWGNVMLIALQRPEATRVAGYQTWLQMGRHVRRGEKAIKIIAPAYYKKKEVKDTGEESEVTKTFFRAVSVFDYGQTEGEELPEFNVPVLDSEAGGELYEKLERLAVEEGVTVTVGHRVFEERTGLMGFFEPRSKAIFLRRASTLQMTKTLAHEVTHHFAEHDQSDPGTETEAEAVSYVVLAKYGLDSGERSFPYVASWARKPEVLKAHLGRIQEVSKTIIGRLEPKVEADADAS